MKKDKKITASVFFGGRPYEDMTMEERREAYIKVEMNALKALYQARGLEVISIETVEKDSVSS